MLFTKSLVSGKQVNQLLLHQPTVFEKTCATSQKNVRKRNHLVMQPLITQLPEDGTGKSRSPTSNILLRCVDSISCN